MSYQDNIKKDNARKDYRSLIESVEDMNNPSDLKGKKIDKNNETEKSNQFNEEEKQFFSTLKRLIGGSLIILFSLIFSNFLLCFLMLLISILWKTMKVSWLLYIICPSAGLSGLFIIIPKIKKFRDNNQKVFNKIKEIGVSILKRIKDHFIHAKFPKKVLLIILLLSVIFSVAECFIPYARTRAMDSINSSIQSLQQEISKLSSEKEVKQDVRDNNDINLQQDEELLKMRELKNVPSFIITEVDDCISKELYEQFFNVNYNDGIIHYFQMQYNPDDDLNFNHFDYEIVYKQNLFEEKIAKALEFEKINGRNNNWYSLLPKDDELLSIIEQKKSEAYEEPSFQLYNSISNDYQDLGDECHLQGYKKQCKYYYIKSFENDLFSLQLAKNSRERNIAIERICYRYKDVELYCKNEFNSYEMELLRKYIIEIDEYLDIY